MDKGAKIKVEHEISRIEKLITDATPLLNLCKAREPDFVEMTATAQILHSFYNGIESVIILFLKNNGEKLPNDIHWHRTLFEMAFGNNSKNLHYHPTGFCVFCTPLGVHSSVEHSFPKNQSALR